MQSSGLGMDSDNDIYTGHCLASNLVIRRRFLLLSDDSCIVGGVEVPQIGKNLYN